jgi:hypothetical protein
MINLEVEQGSAVERWEEFQDVVSSFPEFGA